MLEDWQQETDPIDWLRAEYTQKKSSNDSYSLRAFARRLNINSGRLSDYLSKKRRISRKVGERIANQLLYPPEKKDRFLALLESQKNKHKRIRALNTQEEENEFQTLPSSLLSRDEFHLIADWHHYAIISLSETKDFESAPKSIAKRLGISTIEVRSALERLERLGLIKTVGSKIKSTKKKITTGEDINSVAINTFHEQTLKKAIECLHQVPVELRDNTAMTMAIDVSKIPLAKKIIKNFRRSLAELLEEGNSTEVYNLNIVLFPLSRRTVK